MNKRAIELSIIALIYNAGDTISKCIDDILNKKFIKIQLI